MCSCVHTHKYILKRIKISGNVRNIQSKTDELWANPVLAYSEVPLTDTEMYILKQ